MKIQNPHYIYRKMFTVYTIAILTIVLILEIYFVASIRLQLVETNRDYQHVMNESASKIIRKLKSKADFISYSLYGNGMGDVDSELYDILWFMEYPYEEYLSMRLDAYFNSGKLFYKGLDDFVNDNMNSDEQIEQISFLSYKKKKDQYFDKDGLHDVAVHSGDPLNTYNNETIISQNKIVFKREIREPNTMENLGCMFITYKINELISNYEYYKKGQMIILNDAAHVLYQTDSDLVSNTLYDINQELYSTNKLSIVLSSYVLVEKVDSITVISYMDQQEAAKMPYYLWLTLLCIGAVLLFLGAMLVHFHLKNLSKRLENILVGMEQVESGNLSVRIDNGKEKDELHLIGERFNHMCERLDAYIEKSYMAEIAQKNAEVSALQSQINPHFLYNTLESIRMKAISNGDKEVGKMLYGLAVIFRSQIKDENHITLARELHYCKKYLELFEFRYQNKFDFAVDCDDEYMQVSVIKFIVQPIIENYFVHGIRLEDSDNYLKISVQKDGDDMVILVEDNGSGMTDVEIIAKNLELQEKTTSNKSIGIRNVQLRMAAEYGSGYGLYLRRAPERGLIVELRFPQRRIVE